MRMCVLGVALALIAAMPNLVGCAGSQKGDGEQFQRQTQRAKTCKEMQDKLIGSQPLTPERAEEITKTMDQAGCAARLPGKGF
jgi:hypothetical protein